MRLPRRGAPAPAGRLRSQLPALLLLVPVAAVLLASCSSGGGASANGSSSTTSTPARATTTTTGGPASSTSTAPTTTTSGASTTGAATCQPRQLSAATGQPTGAAGTISLTISLTNTSSATCVLGGYPGMQLLDAQGNAIPTTVVRGQFRFPQTAANQSPSTVQLAPHAAATFSLAYEDVPVGAETSCPTSVQAEITPPNDVTYLVMPLAITPCNNGTVHVSPVYPS